MQLHFHNPNCAHNPLSIQSRPKICVTTLVNFQLSIPPLFLNKIILTIPTKTLLLYTSAVFCLPNFASHIFYLPQSFSQFRLRPEPKDLVKNDTVLISPFFLKVETLITGLKITDSLSLRLRKLVYYRE